MAWFVAPQRSTEFLSKSRLAKRERTTNPTARKLKC
jgi:hypothetical protein